MAPALSSAIESSQDSSVSNPASNLRVTRSSARLAAESAPVIASTSLPDALPPPSTSRKRKASAQRDFSPTDASNIAKPPSPRRSKRLKVAAPEQSSMVEARPRHQAVKQKDTMANSGSSSGPLGNSDDIPITEQGGSRRRSGRNKKINQEVEPPSLPTSTSKRRTTKKGPVKKAQDVAEKNTDEPPKNELRRPDLDTREADLSEDDDPGGRRGYDDDEDDGDDPFRGSFLGAGGPSNGISSTLRALTGMVSGVSTRLREILNNLRQKDDPSVQLIALQELSEILLVSTEDNLSGHFSPDQFVKELVRLMQPSERGEENAEMMLLACRCIANLMEALPQSTANIVYGGAVAILCQKLLEINFIDLAEQALSTLEKISFEFPSVIVREGGLTACLSYLDFFATSTQRTAVTTAANCCRNIALESFPVIKDVMPILLNVLGSNDQKVVEQGSLCVSRIVESFRYQRDKLEELISTNMLKAIRRLLLPGTTNLIGPNIHTQFLSVLAITARASPTLSTELLKMNIVDTIYQFLTGVSPPQGVDNVASQIDSVLIMQALIHKPREQVYETLNFICELLPGIQTEGLSFNNELFEVTADDSLLVVSDSKSTAPPNTTRIQLLEGCKEELKRFAVVLLPTLTDAYSSTVNLSVRQRVLIAQLKMLSNIDTSILEAALRSVPYASYLASILSQQDHPTLVVFALQAAELLLVRLEKIYRYQFYREGVMAEIAKLASRKEENKIKASRTDKGVDNSMAIETTDKDAIELVADKAINDDQSEDDHDPDEDEEDEEDESNDVHDDMFPSPSESSSSDQNYTSPSLGPNLHDQITLSAQKILEVHEDSKGTDMRDKATAILRELQLLAKDIECCYLGGSEGDGARLFLRLSSYFTDDSLESITSFELLHSQVAQVLLDVFSNANEYLNTSARKDFLEVFMSSSVKGYSSTQDPKASSTPFGVLVHKLQDLLSRAEHFEVRTVRYSASENNRTQGNSILAKQIKLNLSTDDGSETPRPYRNVIISIHAIATFQNLDEYLRPRISLSERPRSARHREGVSNALAAFAAAAGIPNPAHRLTERNDAVVGNIPVVPSQPNTTPAARGPRRASKTKGGSSASDPTPVKEKVTVRRSSRRHQPASQSSSEVIPKSPEQTQAPLECADERQVTDEDDIDDSNALDAIVDDLQDRMETPSMAEPSAVNMEIAPTGKVTARKDDGTRVPTPSQVSTAISSPPSSRSRDFLAAGINSAVASRAMSYAAAIQAIPQDWHLEFSVRGKPVSNETTIYQAVANQDDTSEASNRHVWSSIHEVNFKRVPGPPAPRPSTITSSGQTLETRGVQLPNSLNQNSETSIILRLLNILHELNAHLDDVLGETHDKMTLNVEPLAQFVNTKLTAKLNRQLEEPLIVASKCLPSWSQDLARLYPFLFPFETRHLFLQSTAFGYCRSVARWQSAQPAEETRRERHREDRPFINRIQRQKVRIARARFLESALKVMELYGASPSILEIEYFEEVGTGLGPTLEFYSTVSKEFSRKDIKLWRDDDSNPKDDYVFSKLGLFPSPMSAEHAESGAGKRKLHLFKMLGKFIARSMLDSRIIDLSFNPTFFRITNHQSPTPLSLGFLKMVDSHLAKSLRLLKQFAAAKRQIDDNADLSDAEKAEVIANYMIDGVNIESLGLDFVLPGDPTLELVKDGANTPVTMENVGAYVEKVIDMTMGSGVEQQIESFKVGFSQVFPSSALQAFTSDELVMLFGRNEEDWSLETLLDSIKADHGFNMDSKSVRNLLQVMSELSSPQRRNFLQFVTGSPKLPIGGFKSLTPMFTVVCKPSEPPYTSDDFLISVMTCANYVKLPDYSSIDILRKRLMTAIEEGQGAFHLS